METFLSLIIVFVIMVIMVWALIDFVRRVFLGGNGSTDNNAKMICTHCGTRGTPKSITSGSIGIEIILWICFLIPGLIYSIWRISSRKDGCPACGMPNMIRVDTPHGGTLVKKFQQQ